MQDLPPSSPQGYGLIRWFLKNSVASNILMVFLIVGGLISIFSIRSEVFPSIDPRMISVRVAYPGATPYEVADSITRRIEERLIGIEGIKKVTAVAAEGYGAVTIEMDMFADQVDVYNEVETAVQGLSNFPPGDAERPIIQRIKITPNVMTLALYGFAPEKTLRYWAQIIEDELRLLPGVALTTMRGIRDYEISIEISEQELRKYALDFESIRAAIQNFSQDIPAGTIESSQGEILLRVQEKRRTAEEFEDIVIKMLPDGSTLRLGDIATVIDGFEDIGLRSRYNNKPAVFIDVKRNADEDTLRVAKEVEAYLKTVKLPTGLMLSLQEDQTRYLKERMNLMVRNGLLGFALVFTILLLFLDLKLSFWISLAIPVSFLGGIFILFLYGESLNMISLFAMIVVLGIVVDDGIVIGESIFEAQERSPLNPDAVFHGVTNVVAPVTVGVITTMAAFAPLIFSTGTLGQIIGIIPVVVIAILFISLVEAYFILPTHLAHPGQWSLGLLDVIRNTVRHGLKLFIHILLLPLVRLSLSWRYVTLGLFISSAIMVFLLVTSGTVRFVFFPQIESDQIEITITMPVGTPFSLTETAVETIEQEIDTLRQNLEKDTQTEIFKSISVSIGGVPGRTSGPQAGSGAMNASHLAQIRILLVSSDLRPYAASEIESMIRSKISDIPNIDKIEFMSSLIGEEKDVEFELSYPDTTILAKIAERLKQEIARLPGAEDIGDSFSYGKDEYVFTLTKEGLAVGLSPAELGQQLRAAYFGLEVQRFQRGRSEIIVYLRYPKQERENLAMLKETRIRLPSGDEVPLSTVATITQQKGFSQIQTVHGQPIVRVYANADQEITTPNMLLEEIANSILPQLQKEFPQLSYQLEGGSREQREDMSSLGRNMLIGLMLIYVILAAQLQSYVQPLVIMAAIPFGVVGAILGHFFLGYDLTFISLFGVVALAGVVINDSVVLLNYLNSHHRAGASLRNSIIYAVKRRFRPILLTTLSTCLGLLPMLLETSLQARFLIPMVISLSIGILFATFVILFLIPCLVMIIEDMKRGIYPMLYGQGKVGRKS